MHSHMHAPHTYKQRGYRRIENIFIVHQSGNFGSSSPKHTVEKAVGKANTWSTHGHILLKLFMSMSVAGSHVEFRKSMAFGVKDSLNKSSVARGTLLCLQYLLKEHFTPKTTRAYFIVDWDTINTILG